MREGRIDSILASETPSRDHEEQKCWLARITQMGREIVRTETPSSQCYMLHQWTSLQAKNLLRKHPSGPHFEPPESDHLLALLSKSLTVYPDIFKATQFENCHIPQDHLPKSHIQANLASASNLLSGLSEPLSVSVLVGGVGWTYFPLGSLLAIWASFPSATWVTFSLTHIFCWHCSLQPLETSLTNIKS